MPVDVSELSEFLLNMVKWPQIGPIWDFLRSVSVHFGLPSQNVLIPILKSRKFVTFGANLTQFGVKIAIPVTDKG